MSKSMLALGLLVGVLVTSTANAKVYDVSYISGTESVNFTVSTSDTLDPDWVNGFDILDVNGMRGTQAMSLVATSGPGLVTDASVGTNPIVYDNVFYPSAPNFDVYGLFYETPLDYYNLYYESGQWYELTPEQKDAGSLGTAIAAPTVVAAPEPAMWVMMLLGIGSLGAAIRGRRTKDGQRYLTGSI